MALPWWMIAVRQNKQINDLRLTIAETMDEKTFKDRTKKLALQVMRLVENLSLCDPKSEIVNQKS
jgi:hypothetical protein